jgi:hypothetical protein
MSREKHRKKNHARTAHLKIVLETWHGENELVIDGNHLIMKVPEYTKAVSIENAISNIDREGRILTAYIEIDRRNVGFIKSTIERFFGAERHSNPVQVFEVDEYGNSVPASYGRGACVKNEGDSTAKDKHPVPKAENDDKAPQNATSWLEHSNYTEEEREKIKEVMQRLNDNDGLTRLIVPWVLEGKIEAAREQLKKVGMLFAEKPQETPATVQEAKWQGNYPSADGYYWLAYPDNKVVPVEIKTDGLSPKGTPKRYVFHIGMATNVPLYSTNYDNCMWFPIQPPVVPNAYSFEEAVKIAAEKHIQITRVAWNTKDPDRHIIVINQGGCPVESIGISIR